jgi:hypothetical protein
MSTVFPICRATVISEMTFKFQGHERIEKTSSSDTCENIGSELKNSMFHQSDYFATALKKCREIVHLNDPSRLNLWGYKEVSFDCSGLNIYQVQEVTKCFESVGLSSSGRKACFEHSEYLKTIL